MEALRTWARHLISLAVLAGLIEIALPRSTLRAPARLVLGLVLLVAVLAPALDLLHTSVQWDAAATTAVSALPDYRKRADQLSKATDDLARRELQRRLEQAAELAARRVPGVGGARASIELGEAAPGEPPAISRVQLLLRPVGFGRVAPVEPVATSGAAAGASTGAGMAAGVAPAGPDPAMAAMLAAATQAVARDLGLAADRVVATLAP